MTEEPPIWLYAVTEARAVTLAPGELAGVSGASVRMIEADGLAAAASEVPLAEFGEVPLRAHLEDLAWLEATATAHHGVVDALSRSGPVVPMRLATMYSSEENVRGMLGERGSDLRAVLRRTTGCQEWGVKVYHDDDGSPAGRSPAGSGSASGAEYLRRRREELHARDHGRRAAAASAERVHAALCQLAEAARLYPPQAPELTGTRAAMIMNAAYLVTESAGTGFRAAVERLAGGHPAVRLHLTGPWPPYSFAAGGRADDELAGIR